jgi:general secretion pathway protein C
METILRRHSWAIDLAAVALAAVFTAMAAANLAAASLVGAAPVVEAAARARPLLMLPADKGDRAGDAIVERNIFCSTCRPAALAAAADPSDSARASVPSALPLRVMAIMYAARSADARWSVAIIRDHDRGATAPYGVGSRLHGGAQVVAIGQTRVYLEEGGARRHLDLLNGHAAALAPSRAPAAAAAGGIQKMGPRRYRIERDALETLLGTMPSWSHDVRAVPDPAGLRLLSVPPDSPLGRIGLESGDLIRAVNGLEMTLDHALAALAKLRTANHVSVALDRRGTRVTYDYSIH